MKRIFSVAIAMFAALAFLTAVAAPSQANIPTRVLNGPDSLDFFASISYPTELCVGFYASSPYEWQYAQGAAQGWNEEYRSLNVALAQNGYDIVLSRVTTRQVYRWLIRTC